MSTLYTIQQYKLKACREHNLSQEESNNDNDNDNDNDIEKISSISKKSGQVKKKFVLSKTIIHVQ